jgi:hypothetical protein
MWDLLCKLLSEELFFCRFQRDPQARKVTLQHDKVQAQAGSVDNSLWKFVRGSQTTERAWQILGRFWRCCIETAEERGRIVISTELARQMIGLLEAAVVEVEIDERAVRALAGRN